MRDTSCCVGYVVCTLLCLAVAAGCASKGATEVDVSLDAPSPSPEVCPSVQPAPSPSPANQYLGLPKPAAPAYRTAARRWQDDAAKVYWPGHNTETYDNIDESPFLAVTQNPLSTFSVDVDTASYSNVRRFLNENTLPPRGAVRIEELVNYFPYHYRAPEEAPEQGAAPFAAHVDVAGCPWTPEHRLVRVGVKGWEMPRRKRPASNLVFLIDTSGSMGVPNKLPLLKRSLHKLVKQLDERDTVAMVTYAGSAGLVLPATSGGEQATILAALGRLESGGSTNGGQGIQLAYDTASAHFIEGGVNRVILATDGDFNVGVTDRSQLIPMVEERAKRGVFLTVLGFGMGNIKDATLEQLADKGNGSYAYIDTFGEARKVLGREMLGSLITIAKDVKIQVEFNPAKVQAYRLIGYENRMLRAEDFNDDAKDAGEIGAGHTVTAFYEVVPPGVPVEVPGVDPLKYPQPAPAAAEPSSDELLTLKMRYKQPDGNVSAKLEWPVCDGGGEYAQADEDFRFAASVAAFGMVLRNSKHKGGATYGSVIEWAERSVGLDPHGYRKEFLGLVRKADRLSARADRG